MLNMISNIAANAVKRKNFTVMIGKVFSRFREEPVNQNADVHAWCAAEAEAVEPFLRALDAALCAETEKVCAEIKAKAEKKLEALDLDMGGGGHYQVLYFFARYLKPAAIVETGVAAGWSSQALLSALRVNGGGTLFSSDFPYFRYKNPEELVGYVVDEDLKGNWTLHIDGDQNNLPKIAAEAREIGLFHYDSDKSYAGRNFAFDILRDHLAVDALVVFDDIQDNAHFMDFVAQNPWPYKVFEFEGKYIGMTGPRMEALISAGISDA